MSIGSPDSTVGVEDHPASAEPVRDATVAHGKSPTRIAMDRLRKDRVAMTCLGVVLFFILIAIFAPVLAKLEGGDVSTFQPDLVDEYGFPVIGMNSEHWFGVEPKTGRDNFARWVYGARPSLIVAFVATLVGTVVGVVMGLLAGFLGGWVDRIISWFIDFVLSLPYLLFAIAMVPIVESLRGGSFNLSPEEQASTRFFVLIFVLSFFGWAGLARIIRGEVLSLREREFVLAAKAIGVPTRQVLFKELLPNLVAPIVISASLALPAYVTAEAGLSFLGVGLIEPIPSWGQTIATATNWFKADPVYLWLPVIGITALVLALALLGDAVRDAFDPKTRR
ncbi:binding-protein-dependent transport systems inner membrane component [Kribbella flavida DSM 17836]|uniref:Binding-protein-dependent transport systems inner membrane component n=1 Tax=Kribbella flavida (strain DSM 17836 / JCM 10339 / NBRC 14399) TaxID=479435 RepID=D2PYW7_KRIFD|nr:ABC transporter permease [Kribbella flavida]ADB31761.1 binding-protein-dependent transport systems inner membrane component [Kribbella flavida DSM 17836]